MSPFQSSLFKGSGKDLFSPAQIQHLMRVEFERAQRYQYPVVLLLIAVDRLAQLQDLYGSELRDSVLRALTSQLRSTSRASDIMGCLIDDRLLVLVPHTPAEGAAVLAKRILDGVRSVNFESAGRPTRVTVSIGGAHNQQRRSELAFDTMLEVAEGGLKVATESGGNRYVHSDLYDFFEQRRQRDERERQKHEPQAPIPAAASTVTPPPVASGAAPASTDPDGQVIGAKIRELFGLSDNDQDMLARIEKEVVASALREMKAELERALGHKQNEHQRQIDTLERRIQKLTQSLGMTEAELKRALQQKNVDPGVASMYDSVRGLSSDDVQHELKKELMSKIFQANLELRKQITPGASDQTGA